MSQNNPPPARARAGLHSGGPLALPENNWRVSASVEARAVAKAHAQLRRRSAGAVRLVSAEEASTVGSQQTHTFEPI